MEFYSICVYGTLAIYRSLLLCCISTVYIITVRFTLETSYVTVIFQNKKYCIIVNLVDIE